MIKSQLRSFWVTDLNHLSSFYTALHDLCSSLEHPIFFSPDWFQAALQWQPQNTKLCCWLLSAGDEIKGIVPLVAITQKRRGIAHTCLQWLKVPDTQFCDIIALPQDKPMVLKHFFADLMQKTIAWDTLELYPLDSSLMELAQDLSPGFAHTSFQSSQHYWIDLGMGWEKYYQSRSRRLKKGNNHLANRLKSAGTITLENVSENTHYSLEQILQIITDLSQGSWKLDTNTTFNNDGPKHFIEYLTKKALDNGWLSIWLLSLNKQPIAFEYQLHDQGNVYALRSDFDERYRELSAGSYLNWKILEQLFSSGYNKYFMGPGSNAYKTRWQNQCINLFTFKGYANTLKGRLLYGIDQMSTKLKPVRAQLTKSNKENQS